MNLKILGGVSVVFTVIVFLITWYATQDTTPQSTQSPSPVAEPVKSSPLPPPPIANIDQAPIMEGHDVMLSEFSFQNMTLPNYVPDASTRMVQLPSGNPPYKLINCDIANAYAIRWNGRFLNMLNSNKLEWTTNKREPDGCWTIVPGYCGGDGRQFIMLRSTMNKLFLRIDEMTGMLVCKDGPTSRTAAKYCWKFKDDTPTKVPCGTQYSEELKQMIDIPCTIIKDPPAGSSGCSAVTKGFVSKCCARYPNDTDCRASFWREVVGRQLTEAVLYLKTRRPDLTLQPCPSPCDKDPFPVYKENVVMIPYDPRSGYVTAPAFRFV